MATQQKTEADHQVELDGIRERIAAVDVDVARNVEKRAAALRDGAPDDLRHKKRLDELDEADERLDRVRRGLLREAAAISERLIPEAQQRAEMLRTEAGEKERSSLVAKVTARLEAGRSLLPPMQEAAKVLSADDPQTLSLALARVSSIIRDARHNAGLEDSGEARVLLRKLEAESIAVAEEIRGLADAIVRGVRYEYQVVKSRAEKAREAAAEEQAQAERKRQMEEKRAQRPPLRFDESPKKENAA